MTAPCTFQKLPAKTHYPHIKNRFGFTCHGMNDKAFSAR